MSDPYLVYQDADFRVEHCKTCALPGYLILTVLRPCESFAQLPPALAGALGVLLSRSVAAIEKLTGAPTVYVLRFGEELRQVHFHLFPRGEEFAKAYRENHPERAGPINGSLMFDWARKFFALSEPKTALREAAAALRELLGSTS
jgi:diadenosine tetraphosphate (Ap4A) HIT family hydrolase